MLNKLVIFQSQLTKASFLIAIACFVATSIVLGVKYQSLPPQIPLFYSRPWGEGRLATSPFVWIVPGTILILIFINTVLISKVGVRFATKILALSMAITSFLLFWTLVKIIFTIS